jgi:hypothetical protein
MKQILSKTITDALSKILSLKDTTKTPKIPSPIILNSQNRSGLSALKIANKVLQKKRELGLPTGNYEDGTANYNDIIIKEIIEQILIAIQEDAKITVAIPLGIPVTASGIGGDGVPVVVQGATTNIQSGGAIIQ